MTLSLWYHAFSNSSWECNSLLFSPLQGNGKFAVFFSLLTGSPATLSCELEHVSLSVKTTTTTTTTYSIARTGSAQRRYKCQRTFFPLLTSNTFVKQTNKQPWQEVVLTYKSNAMILMLSFTDAEWTGKTKVSLCRWILCIRYELCIAIQDSLVLPNLLSLSFEHPVSCTSCCNSNAF